MPYGNYIMNKKIKTHILGNFFILSLTSTDEEGVRHECFEEVDQLCCLLGLQLPQLKLHRLEGEEEVTMTTLDSIKKN